MEPSHENQRNESSDPKRTSGMLDLNDDDLRRKKEINLFASFALGGEEPIAGFDFDKYPDIESTETQRSRYNPSRSNEAEGKAFLFNNYAEIESSTEENIPEKRLFNQNHTSEKISFTSTSSDIEWNFLSDSEAGRLDISNDNQLDNSSERGRKFVHQSMISSVDDPTMGKHTAPNFYETSPNYFSETHRDDQNAINLNETFVKSSYNDNDTLTVSPLSKTSKIESIFPNKVESLTRTPQANHNAGLRSELSNFTDSWDEGGDNGTTPYQPYMLNTSSPPSGVRNDDARETFLIATRQDENDDSGDYGTFNFTPTKQSKPPGPSEQSNLDAAVAALSKNDSDHRKGAVRRNTRQLSLPKPLIELEQQQQRKASAEKLGMFAEEIIMPRPLFFGPIIHPRILQGAKAMVRDAVEQYYESQHRVMPPRLYELPVEVRNVVGALRIYGFGLLDEVVNELKVKSPQKSVKAKFVSSLTSNSEDSAMEQMNWSGNPYISTFQPVWGSHVRVERLKTYRKQQKRQLKRPKQLTGFDRSITAPARLPILNLSEDEEYDDDDDLHADATLLKYVTDNAVSPLKDSECSGSDHRTMKSRKQSASIDQSTSNISPNDMFAMWLRKDDDSISAGSCASLKSKEGNAMNTPPPTNITKAKVLPSPFTITPINNKSELGDHDDNCESSDEEISDNDSLQPSTTPLSEQQLFAQWACGGDSVARSSDKSFKASSSLVQTGKSDKELDGSVIILPADSDGTFRPMNTFQKMRDVDDRDSDDGSFIDDEQKKQVGVNDHLSKAIALLEDDGQPLTNDSTTIEQSQVLLSQIDQDGSRKRPLTNYELTSGCVPLYGVDDAPLPQEADLGIHETREEQQRAQEQKRSQEIIEKFVTPNIFGTVACPNPALGPDDFDSWNSRIATSSTQDGLRFPSPGNGYIGTDRDSATGIEVINKRQYNSYGSSPAKLEAVSMQLPGRDNVRSRSAGNSVDLDVTPNSQQQLNQMQEHPTHPSNPQRHHQKPPKHTGKRSNESVVSSTSIPNKTYRRFGRQRKRFGWWNVTEEAGADHDNTKLDDEETTDDGILQIPPIHHSANALSVSTKLDPSPEKLHADNLPLSTMHSATSMEQSLPYLSDRPQSYRYLQIETQTIAFPPLKGEIEPLFCSLAIYNVETISSANKTHLSGAASGGSGSNNKTRSVPIPNLQRCGRVTESLYFDHVVDDGVAHKCNGALYPYSDQSSFRKDETSAPLRSISTEETVEEKSQGTR
jgi:hypothetical protein